MPSPYDQVYAIMGVSGTNDKCFIFAVAYLVKDSDPTKARTYAAKSVELNPSYQDAVNLNKSLNK